MFRNEEEAKIEEKKREGEATDKSLDNTLLEMVKGGGWFTGKDFNAAKLYSYNAIISRLEDSGVVFDRKPSGINRYLAYKFVDWIQRIKVTDEDKINYWSSEHWAAKRLERFKFDNNQCSWCGEKAECVHHWKYKLFNEEVSDLMSMCDSCHERIHSYPGVKMCFPKYVDVEIAEKLKLLSEDNDYLR